MLHTDNNFKHNRTTYIDIAKCIGILIVIYAHSMGKPLFIGSSTFNLNFVLLAMPLFFIISGYFYKVNSTMNVIRKGMNLLKAYAITIVAFVAYFYFIGNHYDAKLWLIGGLYGSGYDYTDRIFWLKGVGGLWFFLALFWARLFVNYALSNQEKIFQIIVILVVAYLGVRTYQIFVFPMGIQCGMFAALFMYLGVCFREKNIFENLNIYTWFICVVIWLYASQANETVAFVNCEVEGGLAVCGGIAGSVMIIGISKAIYKIKIFREVMSYFGEKTMYILCAHIFELHTGLVDTIRQNVNLYFGFDINIFIYRVLWSFFFAWLIHCGVVLINKIKLQIPKKNEL